MALFPVTVKQNWKEKRKKKKKNKGAHIIKDHMKK